MKFQSTGGIAPPLNGGVRQTVVTPSFAPPTLQLGDYVLRPFRKEDAPAWFEYLTDPRVTEHTSWPPITLDFVSGLVEKVLNDYANLQSLRWAVAGREDNVLVGSCGYTRCLGEEGKRSLLTTLRHRIGVVVS
jgi:RimJ/RimL family protein N-acetyltransferase